MKKITKIQFFVISIAISSILALMVIVHNVYNIPFYKMTRDMAAQANVHPLLGFVSNIGILLWWSSATICLFTSTLLLQMKQHELCKFFFLAALLTAWLSLDDFFQFHDYLIGKHEMTIFIVLAASMLFFLVRFQKTILQSNYFFLFLSLCFLACSIVVDQFHITFEANDEIRIFLEDGFKWLGISFWFCYFTTTAFQHLQNQINN